MANTDLRLLFFPLHWESFRGYAIPLACLFAVQPDLDAAVPILIPLTALSCNVIPLASVPATKFRQVRFMAVYPAITAAGGVLQLATASRL